MVSGPVRCSLPATVRDKDGNYSSRATPTFISRINHTMQHVARSTKPYAQRIPVSPYRISSLAIHSCHFSFVLLVPPLLLYLPPRFARFRVFLMIDMRFSDPPILHSLITLISLLLFHSLTPSPRYYHKFVLIRCLVSSSRVLNSSGSLGVIIGGHRPVGRKSRVRRLDHRVS